MRASVQRESPLAAVQELFGATANDPGHWNLSPEWWGTQNGGWGRSEGETVFAATSKHGNGRVRSARVFKVGRERGRLGRLAGLLQAGFRGYMPRPELCPSAGNAAN